MAIVTQGCLLDCSIKLNSLRNIEFEENVESRAVFVNDSKWIASIVVSSRDGKAINNEENCNSKMNSSNNSPIATNSLSFLDNKQIFINLRKASNNQTGQSIVNIDKDTDCSNSNIDSKNEKIESNHGSTNEVRENANSSNNSFNNGLPSAVTGKKRQRKEFDNDMMENEESCMEMSLLNLEAPVAKKARLENKHETKVLNLDFEIAIQLKGNDPTLISQAKCKKLEMDNVMPNIYSLQLLTGNQVIDYLNEKKLSFVKSNVIDEKDSNMIDLNNVSIHFKFDFLSISSKTNENNDKNKQSNSDKKMEQEMEDIDIDIVVNEEKNDNNNDYSLSLNPNASVSYPAFSRNVIYFPLRKAPRARVFNSVLQILFHIPFIRHGVKRIFDSCSAHGNENDKVEKEPFVSRMNELIKVFNQLSICDNNSTKYESLPQSVRENIDKNLMAKGVNTESLVRSFNWKSKLNFDTFDASQFIQFLFNQYLPIDNGNEGNDWNNSDNYSKQKEQLDNMYKQLFCGEWEYYSTMNENEDESKLSSFDSIDLNVPSKDLSRNRECRSIINSLIQFIVPNEKSNENIRFRKFPPILLLQFNRFEFDMIDGKPFKNNSKCKYDATINLNSFIYDDSMSDNEWNNILKQVSSKHMTNRIYKNRNDNNNGLDFEYNLFGVLCHAAREWNGDYYTFINPSGRSSRDMATQWYCFGYGRLVFPVDANLAIENEFGQESQDVSMAKARTHCAYALVYIQKKYISQLLNQNLRGRSIENENENDEIISICNDTFYFTYGFFDDIVNKQQRNVLEYDRNEKNEKMKSKKNFGISVWDVGSIVSDYFYKIKRNKSDTFVDLFDYLEKKHNIKKENQLIFVYAERRNHTMRPNREIFNQYRYKRVHHPIDENSSIYMKRKHGLSFLLFDYSKIHRLYDIDEYKHNNSNNGDGNGNGYGNGYGNGSINKNVKTLENDTLLVLKYFDIFRQRLVLIDAVLVHRESTLSDIVKYFNEKFISGNGSELPQMGKLKEFLKSPTMSNMSIFDYLLVFEEESAVDIENVKICPTDYGNQGATITSMEIITGDILIFSLNAENEIIAESSMLKQSKNILQQNGEIWQWPIDNFVKYCLTRNQIENGFQCSNNRWLDELYED